VILYNTIVGLAAGVALILVANLLGKLAKGEKLQPEGFALSFAMTGFILIALGMTISVMWPYNKVLHANIMFGEPALAFGVLLAAAAFFLWRERSVFIDLGEGNEKSVVASNYLLAVLRPVSAWIFATGLMMASLTAAILYYKLGQAPPQEPISGHFSQSWVEPIFLGLLWGLTALGAMLLPVSLFRWSRRVVRAATICWRVAGGLFVLFSAMNYFTHIGLLINTSDSF
jgi:uncharacterized membrane protein YciS (DUF1049 family)